MSVTTYGYDMPIPSSFWQRPHMLHASKRTLMESPEQVRSVYITRTENANGGPQVDLIIGIDDANHLAVFAQGQSVADAVQRLRVLANQIEAGAIKRMENQR